MAPVLELPAAQRINGVVLSVQNVGRALAGSTGQDSPAAIDLRESMDAFTRTPLTAI